MKPEFLVLTAATFLASALLTYAARKLAVARGLLDVPNRRSSHGVPTPRGGGVAIVLATTAALLLLAVLHEIGMNLFVALVGGLVVAIVGFVDDYRSLPAGIRLAMHIGVAAWALAWLGGLPPIRIGDTIVSLGAAGYVIGVLGLVWTLNLFNFMDGIDGIAASEAMFIVWSWAWLALMKGDSGDVVTVALIFGAACLGFLIWNWPPAKIFMGDVGSGYLGYVIAVLALAAGRKNSVGLLAWLTLGGVFFIDATVTLVRRTIRGERILEAHRSHAYQWLARRWKSHLRSTAAVTIVNFAWLLPCAWLEIAFPRKAGWIAVAALLPLVGMATAAGAGRRERSVEATAAGESHRS